MSNPDKVLTRIEQHLRPPTGALQFDGDWPGLFVRGDGAIYAAASIRLLQAHIQGLDLAPHAKLFDAAGIAPRTTLTDAEIARHVARLGGLADIVERDVIVDASAPPGRS
jgi:hypothetical protein